MERSVTVMDLVRNGAQPGPTSQKLDVKGAGEAPHKMSLQPGMGGGGVSTMTLEKKGPQQGPTTTTLERTGVHRRDHDPYGDFNFVVEIDGVSAGAFEKCDGISFEVDVIEYRDSLHPWGRKRRGQTSFGNIKLVKGYTTNSALWDWCSDVMQGNFGRKTGAIHLLADDADSGSPIVTYRWVEGWPCKWSGFRFDGKSSGAYMVEEIEIAVEQIFKG